MTAGPRSAISHRHFKEAVEQALLLRGSRDFASRAEYAAFLEQVRRQQNAGRSKRLAEEQAVLRPLPSRRLESCQRLEVTVSSGSLIHVQNNVYSVPSRLIGERVEVWLYAEQLEVRYRQKRIETLPRLRGRAKQHINYRHVIDWLVRKPGAFANYRYREELFPTSRFRLAYDLLHETLPARADREYLEILRLAAHESESAVDEALRSLLQGEQALSRAAVETLLRQGQEAAPCRRRTWPVSTRYSRRGSMSRNTEVKAKLVDCLKELHLPTMRASFEEQARRAQQENLSYEQYLLAPSGTKARSTFRTSRPRSSRRSSGMPMTPGTKGPTWRPRRRPSLPRSNWSNVSAQTGWSTTDWRSWPTEPPSRPTSAALCTG